MVLVISLARVCVSAGTQPKLFTDPATYTATMLGETFTININICNVQNLGGFSLRLGYNTTILNVSSAITNPWYDNAIRSRWIIDVQKQQGYVTFAVNYSQAGNGNGTLASVTFKAAYAGSASCNLHFYDTTLYNSNGNPITCTLQDGRYKFVVPSINMATDKPTYSRGNNVKISGKLMLGSSPFNGLLALEAVNPNSVPILARTLKLITSPPAGNITILNLYPCDGFGDHETSFSQPAQAYFNVTFINNGNVTRSVAIVVNAYDSSGTTLGVGLNILSGVGPGVGYALPNIYIPSWAALGNATVYASLFSKLPSAGGTPYCPESSASFKIIGYGTLGSGAGAPPSGGSPGNYSLTFRLSSNVIGTSNGIYTTYAAFQYQGQSYANSTVFGVNPIICVPNAPYTTIQAGVNAANSTINSILVLPGTYNEHVTISKSLTLVGINPNTTIINGGGTGTVINVTANNVKISRFTIQNGGSLPNSGVVVKNSANIILNNNKITSNSGYGVSITNSTGITLRSNSMIGNKYNFGIFGNSLSYFTQDIDTSNTVNGKPIYYWVNKQNQTIPSNAGFVAVVNSTGIAVRGLNLKNNTQGVLFAFTSNSFIERVNTNNNYYGIYMINSSGNVIDGGNVLNNSVGIYQRYSNGNTICHNSFIGNTQQVSSDYSPNIWDNGYPSGGNYWSNYNHIDLYSGPYQNVIGSDGIGDTPYVINANNTDHYPLMYPWPSHVIAITSVVPSKTIVGQGYSMNATVTVANQGDYTETFNVTLYANTTAIATQSFTLASRNSTTITFMWNTAGFAYGNYTISAYVSLVLGETNMASNNYTGGRVLVSIPGDVDGERRVSALDLGLIGISMFTKPGMPGWNPNCDITNAGAVSAIDITIAGLYLFTKW
jgi:parallel beta-helix repeat protein